MNKIRKLNLIILLACLILNMLPYDVSAKRKRRYLNLDLVSGVNPELELLMHEKSFELDLSRTQNIRVRLKAGDLYQHTDRTSSFKINLYEIIGSDRKFVSTQNLTVKKDYRKSRILGLDAGYFASPTKNIEIDIFDTAQNLINTYEVQLSAYNLDSQVLMTDGLDLDSADCDSDNFDECQLDYLFQKVTFEAKPQRQMSTRVIKGEDGLYKVTIPVPRTRFKFLGRKLRKKKGPNNNSGGNSDGEFTGFGETINISSINIGSSLANSYGIDYENGNLNINNSVYLDTFGKLGIGVEDPQAWLHIRNGDSTTPSMILNPGVLTETPIDGALEFDGEQLYFTKEGNRTTIGAQGPQGPQGPPGPQGAPGIAGPSGTFEIDLVSRSFDPVDDSASVGIASNLSMTFNGLIILGSGNITIKDSLTDSIVENISVDSNQVSIVNNTVVINPSSNFDYSTAYYVQVDNTAILSGIDATTPWDGIDSSDETTWNFTTEAPPGIAVSSRSPSDNATGVGRTSNLSITFNVPVTLNAGNATILHSSDSSNFETISLLSGQVSLSDGGRTVNINPSGTFAYSTAYYVEIDAGAIENSHTGGDYFAGYSGSSVWNFTTTGIPATTINETHNLDASPDYDTATSAVDLANIGGTDSDVTQVIITNNKVAGDSTTIITFNTTTNKPTSVTLATGEVQVISTDPVDNATRFVIENQQYSFYVDGSNNIVFTNEPSGIGVFTARTLTVELTNQ